jgi:hypothetical protein
VPRPGPGSAQIRPPCAWTIPREIGRPSPTPRIFITLGSRPRWKRSNTASSIPGGMPIPSSRTDTTISPPSAAAVIAIAPPSGEYLTALSIRLPSTCWTRP